MKIFLPGFAKVALCIGHLFIKCTCCTSVLERTQSFLVCSACRDPGPGVSNLNPTAPMVTSPHLQVIWRELVVKPNNEAEAPGDRRDLSVLHAFHCHQCFGCPMLAASRGWVGIEGKRPSPTAWQARRGQGRQHPLQRLASYRSRNRFFPLSSIVDWNSL